MAYAAKYAIRILRGRVFATAVRLVRNAPSADKRTYQMDPANADERRCARVETWYLRRPPTPCSWSNPAIGSISMSCGQVKDTFAVPGTFAYQVSGEYAMIMGRRRERLGSTANKAIDGKA